MERGYGGFNTVAVCERANAPRGTMLHHFPSRSALVVASLDHVLGRRVQAFREAFMLERQKTTAGGEAAPFTPRAMLDLLWAEYSGPANVAWLELVSAARTDPDLRTELVEVAKRFDANARLAFTALVPPTPGNEPNHDRLLAFIIATLNGLSIDRSYRSDFDARPVLELLTQVAVAVVGEPTSGARPATAALSVGSASPS